MGQSPSKRVEEALRASPEFAAACDGAFARCRAEAAGAFPGVLPHQLPRAAQLLHADLSASLPLVRRWASASPPSRARVDAALRRAVRGAAAAAEVEARGLDRDEFGDFAAELFGAAVLAGAAGAAARGAAPEPRRSPEPGRRRAPGPGSWRGRWAPTPPRSSSPCTWACREVSAFRGVGL
ncbi:hypothetical protein ACMD2_13486 [Ananas comosus]|uniref:Uncharacterized protein n=1 Tax=Ananas comosus TaxID=4615 RepID=A0A199UMB6_ANACO|nr:hypothetical protein ACMD2_13486 [Ananas comosus]